MATSSRWKPPEITAAVFVVLFIASELFFSVTASRLLPGPMAYRWMMFNGIRLYRVVTVEMADGTRQKIPWEQYVAYNRHGVDYEARLPQHICRYYTGCKAVEIWVSLDRTVRVPCTR